MRNRVRMAENWDKLSYNDKLLIINEMLEEHRISQGNKTFLKYNAEELAKLKDFNDVMHSMLREENTCDPITVTESGNVIIKGFNVNEKVTVPRRGNGDIKVEMVIDGDKVERCLPRFGLKKEEDVIPSSILDRVKFRSMSDIKSTKIKEMDEESIIKLERFNAFREKKRVLKNCEEKIENLFIEKNTTYVSSLDMNGIEQIREFISLTPIIILNLLFIYFSLQNLLKNNTSYLKSLFWIGPAFEFKSKNWEYLNEYGTDYISFENLTKFGYCLIIVILSFILFKIIKAKFNYFRYISFSVGPITTSSNRSNDNDNIQDSVIQKVIKIWEDTKKIQEMVKLRKGSLSPEDINGIKLIMKKKMENAEIPDRFFCNITLEKSSKINLENLSVEDKEKITRNIFDNGKELVQRIINEQGHSMNSINRQMEIWKNVNQRLKDLGLPKKVNIDMIMLNRNQNTEGFDGVINPQSNNNTPNNRNCSIIDESIPSNSENFSVFFKEIEDKFVFFDLESLMNSIFKLNKLDIDNIIHSKILILLIMLGLCVLSIGTLLLFNVYNSKYYSKKYNIYSILPGLNLTKGNNDKNSSDLSDLDKATEIVNKGNEILTHVLKRKGSLDIKDIDGVKIIINTRLKNAGLDKFIVKSTMKKGDISTLDLDQMMAQSLVDSINCKMFSGKQLKTIINSINKIFAETELGKRFRINMNLFETNSGREVRIKNSNPDSNLGYIINKGSGSTSLDTKGTSITGISGIVEKSDNLNSNNIIDTINKSQNTKTTNEGIKYLNWENNINLPFSLNIEWSYIPDIFSLLPVLFLCIIFIYFKLTRLG